MNKPKYQEKIRSIVERFTLEPIFEPEDIDGRAVTRSDISRPGLPLAGFFRDFERERIQVIGNMEHSYLCSLPLEQRKASLAGFFSRNVVMVIVSAGLPIFPEMKELAASTGTPLYRSTQRTSALVARLTGTLNVSLAERVTIHGVLVEVYGEGVLIMGESGIGKSETAIELVKRGHRLIADDAVELKRVSDMTLVGSAPELIKHYIELRGIGIVDVRRIFGMGSVKETEKVNLAIHFEPWDPEKQYERFGLDAEYTDILGIRVPSITIPVKPGRNLAVIIEIAAMNHRQKRMGYNTAEEFNKRCLEFQQKQQN